MGSGVVERLLSPFALRICGWSLKEVSSASLGARVLPSMKSFGSSGVVEGQLESELPLEDLTEGVLAREFDDVVFVERDLEERRGSGAGSGGSDCDA